MASKREKKCNYHNSVQISKSQESQEDFSKARFKIFYEGCTIFLKYFFKLWGGRNDVNFCSQRGLKKQKNRNVSRIAAQNSSKMS